MRFLLNTLRSVRNINNLTKCCENINNKLKLNTLAKHDKYNLRQFSTTPPRNISPLFWVILKPISKLGAILAGRGFRKWWASLPNVKRAIFKDHLKRNRFRYFFIIGGTSTGSIIYYQSHLQVTPLTERIRFIMFTTEQLEEIEKLEKEQVGYF